MLKVLIPREWDPNEQRVASSPDVIRRLASRNVHCRLERGAGEALLVDTPSKYVHRAQPMADASSELDEHGFS